MWGTLDTLDIVDTATPTTTDTASVQSTTTTIITTITTTIISAENITTAKTHTFGRGSTKVQPLIDARLHFLHYDINLLQYHQAPVVHKLNINLFKVE